MSVFVFTFLSVYVLVCVCVLAKLSMHAVSYEHLYIKLTTLFKHPCECKLAINI